MKHHVFAAALALALAVAGAALADPPAATGAVRQACAADVQKFCPDAKPGPGGGLRECIRGHFGDLSDPCKQALMAMRAQHQAAANSPAH